MKIFGLMSALAFVLLVGLPPVGWVRAQDVATDFSGRNPSVQEIEDALVLTLQTRGVEKKLPGAASFDQITFKFNSSELSNDAKRLLDKIGAALKSERVKDFSFDIEGHTDAKGSDAYNMALSKRRAESAKEYLVATLGINAQRLVVVPRGKTDLLYPDDPENAKNRRVVFRGILDK